MRSPQKETTASEATENSLEDSEGSMSDTRHFPRQTRPFALTTAVVFVALSIHPGKSLSLETHNKKLLFIFREGTMSEIPFHVHDFPASKEITLYVSKKRQRQNTANLCKLLLNQTTCYTHGGSCECSTASYEGRLQYVFKRVFQVQDSGKWVFDVWNTNVTKTVRIVVEEDLFSTKVPKQATEKPGRYRNTSTGTKTVTSTSRRPKVASSIPLENVATIPGETPFIHYAHNGAATQKIHQAEQQKGIITIIVILSLVTIFSLIFSVVVWRYPGCTLRLRRALRLGETRNGHPDHSNTETDDAPCRDVSRGHRPAGSKGVLNSSDYLTPVFEPSRPTPEEPGYTPAVTQLANWFRARGRRPKFFSIFARQNLSDKGDNIYEAPSRLPTACTFVKRPPTPYSDYGYLTPTFDPRTNRPEEKPNESSIGCLTSSPIKEMNLPTMMGCHGDHGLYLTPSLAPSTGGLRIY